VRFLYNISLLLYRLGIQIAALFNKKAKSWITGRKNLLEEYRNIFKNNKKPVAWFHCASLGEFEQAKPIIEDDYIQKNFFVLVTFFSPSGYENINNYAFANAKLYLPLDTSSNMRKVIKIVNPKLVCFIKYEFWYNFINELHQQKVATYLISGIFRGNQVFFKPYGAWFLKHLSYFKALFVQNETSKKLLENKGLKNVVLSGDTRFDNIYEIYKNPKSIPEIATFKNQKTLIIGGSTWQPEEDILTKFINKNKEDYKYIIAPHDVSKKHINEITKKLKTPYLLFSEIKGNDRFNDVSVLIIDSIGILKNCYQYADVAFVGGGFSGALHNILEPFAFQIPVLFGPKHQKFPEAEMFLKEGIGYEISNCTSFDSVLNKVLKNKKDIQQKSIKLLNEMKGVKQNIIKILIDDIGDFN
jgi:3-deoxy-D-manno-octulosonic-acid transferase